MCSWNTCVCEIHVFLEYGGSAMARVKQKRRRTALPVLGAAGVSLMAGGASAATAPTANVASPHMIPPPGVILSEEEISDISLATFYVFDMEHAGTSHFG